VIADAGRIDPGLTCPALDHCLAALPVEPSVLVLTSAPVPADHIYSGSPSLTVCWQGISWRLPPFACSWTQRGSFLGEDIPE
jgi:hypothetical protein